MLQTIFPWSKILCHSLMCDQLLSHFRSERIGSDVFLINYCNTQSNARYQFWKLNCLKWYMYVLCELLSLTNWYITVLNLYSTGNYPIDSCSLHWNGNGSLQTDCKTKFLRLQILLALTLVKRRVVRYLTRLSTFCPCGCFLYHSSIYDQLISHSGSERIISGFGTMQIW